MADAVFLNYHPCEALDNESKLIVKPGFQSALGERLAGRVDFRARSISELSALFTASSFGNTLATSGLRTMIFEDSFKRFEYFPRTNPPGKSDRRYSGRSSSWRSFLSFFIVFPCPLQRRAGINGSTEPFDRLKALSTPKGSP
ncbi:MAG: hypothetical protein HY892_04735 [Deltaproteobacteria bacterium]|nr:hypothetical protein [Deltaproteobacteria bacterium]